MEHLEVLLQQFESNSKSRVKDEQLLIKLEKHLNSLELDHNIQTEEIIFLDALQFFQIYKEYKKNTIKNGFDIEIFNARILQISCELLFIGYSMEQKLNLIHNWQDIVYESLKVSLKACMKWLQININSYIGLINRNLDLAKSIYDKYIGISEKLEQDYITELKDEEKLNILSLYYIMELEIELEFFLNENLDKTLFFEEKVIKILKLRSLNPYFTSNELFNSKLANIILKICLKLVQSKNFGSIMNILGNVFDEEFENMVAFNGFASQQYAILFKKIYLLTQIENNDLDEEKMDNLIMKMEREDDTIKNSDNNNDFLLFSFIISIRKYNKGLIDNEEIVSKLKILLTLNLSFEDFSIAYNEIKLLEGKVYLIDEYLKNDTKNWNNEETETILSLIISLIQRIMEYFIGAETKNNNQKNNSKKTDKQSILKKLTNGKVKNEKGNNEDDHTKCIKVLEDANIFHKIINLIETSKLAPKQIIYFLQTAIRFSLFLTYSFKNYPFSSQVLESLIEIQRKTTAKNNKSLLKETYFLQMNNLLMLGRIEMAQEIYYIAQNMEKDKRSYFLDKIMELKLYLFSEEMNETMISLIKSVFNHENFEIDIYVSEIIEPLCENPSEHTFVRIQIIFSILLEILCKEPKRIHNWIVLIKNKSSMSNSFSFLSLLLPILKRKWEYVFNHDSSSSKKQELEALLLKPDTIKEILTIGNFVIDCMEGGISLEREEEEKDIKWLLNERECEFIETFFWNLTIFTGSLKMEMILTKKLIQFTLMMKLILIIIKFNFLECYKEFEKGKLMILLFEVILLHKNEIESLYLYEIVQCGILLITNIFVTLKIELGKNKDSFLRNSDVEFLSILLDFSKKIIEYLVSTDEDKEKYLKTQMLLLTNDFELNIIVNPNKCVFLIEETVNMNVDPDLFFFYSQISDEYNQKKISIHALRTYLKVCFYGDHENQKTLPMCAYREILNETTEEEEYLTYLKQILIFIDIAFKYKNNEENSNLTKDEIIYIILLTIKRLSNFPNLKREILKILHVIYENIKSLLTESEASSLEFFLFDQEKKNPN